MPFLEDWSTNARVWSVHGKHWFVTWLWNCRKFYRPIWTLNEVHMILSYTEALYVACGRIRQGPQLQSPLPRFGFYILSKWGATFKRDHGFVNNYVLSGDEFTPEESVQCLDEPPDTPQYVKTCRPHRLGWQVSVEYCRDTNYLYVYSCVCEREVNSIPVYLQFI